MMISVKTIRMLSLILFETYTANLLHYRVMQMQNYLRKSTGKHAKAVCHCIVVTPVAYGYCFILLLSTVAVVKTPPYQEGKFFQGYVAMLQISSAALNVQSILVTYP